MAEPPVAEPPVAEPPVGDPPDGAPPLAEPPDDEPPNDDPPDGAPPDDEPPDDVPPVFEPLDPACVPPVAVPPVAVAPLEPPSAGSSKSVLLSPHATLTTAPSSAIATTRLIGPIVAPDLLQRRRGVTGSHRSALNIEVEASAEALRKTDGAIAGARDATQTRLLALPVEDLAHEDATDSRERTVVLGEKQS